MDRFFNMDNKFFTAMNRIADLIILNLLCLVLCIPVITIGPALTALFYMTLKMVRNEEGNVTLQFVQAFRSNFKFSTKVWLIMLAAQVVLAFDGYVLWHMRFSNIFWTILCAVFIVLLVACAIIAMYIFPLMARFENTVRAMFFNSIMVGMRYLVCTVIMAAIYFIMAVIVVRFFTPAIIFGEGLCAFLCSYLLAGILEKLAPPREDEDEPSDPEDGSGFPGM